MAEAFSEQWWLDLVRVSTGPWTVGLSDPVCRRLSALNVLTSPPNWLPLKDVIVRLQQSGVPADARKVRASTLIYRVSAGDFNLQINAHPHQHLIVVERLQHPMVRSAR